jgi:6-phosphogluconolactonase
VTVNVQQHARFFIGTYRDSGGHVPAARGEGIVTVDLDPATGELHRVAGCLEAGNATYLALGSGGRLLYAVIDRYDAIGSVASFRIGEDGRLSQLSEQPTFGTGDCHLCLSAGGDFLFSTGYNNGTLTVHRVASGVIGPPLHRAGFKGSGPDPDRQEAAHPHQVTLSPCGNRVLVCDLGSDRVWGFDVEALQRGDRPITVLAAPPGSGPRHLVRHPELPVVYVLTELTADLLVCDAKDMALTVRESHAVRAVEASGKPWASAIRLHPSGRALYAADRGSNAITVYAVNPDHGGLHLMHRSEAGAHEPRDMNVDPSGRWLVVAGQADDRLVAHRLDPNTGGMTGERGPSVSCGTPVCVLPAAD